jgi:hypothetical protein
VLSLPEQKPIRIIDVENKKYSSMLNLLFITVAG